MMLLQVYRTIQAADRTISVFQLPLAI